MANIQNMKMRQREGRRAESGGAWSGAQRDGAAWGLRGTEAQVFASLTFFVAQSFTEKAQRGTERRARGRHS